jgi:hypothetical protein
VSFHNALCSADGDGYFSEFGYQASRPMPARRKPFAVYHKGELLGELLESYPLPVSTHRHPGQPVSD